MYSIELSDEATTDYEDAVAWYEEQKVGLGFDFSVRLAEIFEAIEQFPERQRFLYENRRFAFIKQFPYTLQSLFYSGRTQFAHHRLCHSARKTRPADLAKTER